MWLIVVSGWTGSGKSSWEHVRRGRDGDEPLATPKIVIDSVRPFDENLDAVRRFLG